MKKFYSRFVSKKLLIVLLSFICAGRLWAQTPITSDILSSTTWNIAGSPYIINAAVTVTSGATLTIAPGVIVHFNPKYDGGITLTIDGTLIAKGTADSVIKFEGDANFIDNGTNHRYVSGPIYINSTTPSVLQYVVVDAMGFGETLRNDSTAAIDINSSTCSISYCTIKNVRGTGILYEGSNMQTLFKNTFDSNTVGARFRGISPILDSNHFSKNQSFDVITGFDNLGKLLPSNDFMDAGIGLTADISVTKNDTMSYITSRYVLQEANKIPSGKTLTIKPGVLFHFNPKYDGGITLTIDGTLIAKGTSDNYITFEGDANFIDNGTNHRYVSGPIYINSTTPSVLQYVVVDAMGFGETLRTDNTAAIDISSSTTDINNCKIQNTRGTGLLYHNFSSKRIFDNMFQNNTVGVNFENISPILDSNHFSTNQSFDVITGFDNLGKLLPSNDFMDAGIGLTANLPVGKNDTMSYITSRYVLQKANKIPSGKTLTIQPGVLFQFPAKYDGGITLTIDGTLIAKGASDNYITFEGDANFIDNGTNHRYVSGPIYLSSSSLNSVMQYLKIDAMGFGETLRTDNTAALDISSSSCSIFNSIIQNIRGTGVTVHNASPYIAGTCFNTNRGGVYSTGGKTKILHSNFASNSSFGVKNVSTSDTLDATECWWNSPAGPTNVNTNPVGGDIVSDYVLYNPWATEQPFDCSDPTILPLILLNFQTTLSNNTVNCTWQTATETNTSYFIIQRSTDGANFSSLGKVYASGNSSTSKSYSFTDKAPNNGINYYRLQMVDKDGRYSYSKTLPINISIKQPFAIYPNPVKDVLYVQVQRSVAEQVSLRVIDMQGKTILQQNQQLAAGITTLSVNTTSLAKGSYFIVIKGQTTDKKLFIKE